MTQTTAQRNLTALKAMRKRHTVKVGGHDLEITPPGLIDVVERIASGINLGGLAPGGNASEMAEAAASGMSIGEMLQKFPELAKWLAVKALAPDTKDEGELDEVEALVGGLSLEEVIDLADGIVAAMMPDGFDAAKKKAATFIQAKFGVTLAAA